MNDIEEQPKSPMSDTAKGIAAACASAFVFSANDAVGKLMASGLDPTQVAWLRYYVYAAVVLGFAAGWHGPKQLLSPLWKLQIIRGALAALSAILFLLGLKRLPLADATALNLVGPILIVALASPVLGEKASRASWAAVALGAAGALLIVRPGLGSFSLAGLLVLSSATVWSLASLMTRGLRSEPAWRTMAWSSAIGLILLTAPLAWFWQDPSVGQIAAATALGLGTILVNWLVVTAYRFCAAGEVAPYTYLQFVGASFLGALVFQESLSWATGLGAILIALGGLVARGLGLRLGIKRILRVDASRS